MIKSKKELVNSEEFLAQFNKPEEQLGAKYGLPNEVKFCRKCVISNQRVNAAVEYKHTKDSTKTTIRFDENGVCDACKQAERKKQTIDWDEREKELVELCNEHRRNDGYYDCLIPGSGGKDSFYQAHILKYKYNMHPLTVTWAPHIYTDWGWKNFQAWIHAGFDNHLITPNGLVHRLLTRLSTENLYHPFQPFIVGQKSLAPRIAATMDIPLVFYGENEAEYGTPIDNQDSNRRAWDYFSQSDKSEIYIGGTSVKELKEDYGLEDVDLDVYMPTSPEMLEEKKVDVHYLGYYLSWHPQGAYYYATDHSDFQAAPERNDGSYSKYNSLDDKMEDYHHYTYCVKFGFGRATYDASQEVRNEDITRDEAVALVKKYDGEFPGRFEKEIFEYLSIPEKQFPVASKMFEQPHMTRDYFDDLTDAFRSPHLWKKEDGIWKLRHTVWNEK